MSCSIDQAAHVVLVAMLDEALEDAAPEAMPSHPNAAFRLHLLDDGLQCWPWHDLDGFREDMIAVR